MYSPKYVGVIERPSSRQREANYVFPTQEGVSRMMQADAELESRQ